MLLEVQVSPQVWDRVRVYVAGRPLSVTLRKIDGESRVIAEWPRSGPGAYRVRVDAEGRRRDHVFTIRPSKMSMDDFTALLTSLENELPVSVAIALQRLGGLAGLKLANIRPATLAEEVARVRRAVIGDATVPGLARVLAEIARSPHTVLKTSERWVKREYARRPSPSRLVHAYARRGNIQTNNTPLELVDSRVSQSVDVYENRIIATFVRQVDWRLRRLEQIARVTHTDLLGEAEQLRETLTQARRGASFLDDVSQLRTAPTHTTMVLLRREAYRAAFTGYLAFQRGLAVRLDDPGLMAPLEELPHLYQVWGVLQVIVALLAVARGTGFKVVSEHLIGRDVDGLFMRALPRGKAAIVLSHPPSRRSVQLIHERTYFGGRSSGLHSATFSQVPDIAVEITEPNGRMRVYLFDPKYKLSGADNGDGGQPTKVDMDKMHAYRDSIRDAEDRRVVEYAAILYPGSTNEFGPGLGALSALPSSVDTLQAMVRNVLNSAIG